MLLNAEMKLRAGLAREESRGTHYREDFPYRDDANWLCWVTLLEKDGAMAVVKHPVPAKWHPDTALSYREKYPIELPGEEEHVSRLEAARTTSE
jgi:succinate dehydrogenase/fumarate reductase flavoprotein subunit